MSGQAPPPARRRCPACRRARHQTRRLAPVQGRLQARHQSGQRRHLHCPAGGPHRGQPGPHVSKPAGPCLCTGHACIMPPRCPLLMAPLLRCPLQAAAPRQERGVCGVPHPAPARVPDGCQGARRGGDRSERKEFMWSLAVRPSSCGLELQPHASLSSSPSRGHQRCFPATQLTPAVLHPPLARRCKPTAGRHPLRQCRTHSKTWREKCRTSGSSSYRR